MIETSQLHLWARKVELKLKLYVFFEFCLILKSVYSLRLNCLGCVTPHPLDTTHILTLSFFSYRLLRSLDRMLISMLAESKNS